MLGDNIKNLREEKGLTQNDVVDKAKELKGNSSTFTQSQLSKWEKNEAIPSEENIQLLTKVFNCSIENLKNESENSDFDIIYKEAFNLGKKFKASELDNVMYTATEIKKNYNERITYILDFLMKNSLPIPMCFIEMLKLCQNNSNSEKLEKLYYPFIIGFWNGSYKNTNDNAN